MSRAEELLKRAAQVQERLGYSPAQDRLRRLRTGKAHPRTKEEMAEWRAYVDNPARVLRKITHDTLPKRGKVVATPGPREGELLWWVDGVTYTDDPETVWVLAHKRVKVEDAPTASPRTTRRGSKRSSGAAPNGPPDVRPASAKRPPVKTPTARPQHRSNSR